MNYNTVFIIGNGTSRRSIDLEKLRKHGIIIGCNALYRDFTPDYLVALDRKMEQEIDRSGCTSYKIYRKTHVKGHGSGADYSLKIKPRQVVNSGVAAIYIAMKLGFKDIWLLGFDLSQNNLYEGTSNYARQNFKKLNAPPTRIKNHQQIAKWAKLNSKGIRFRRVVNEHCYRPKEFEGVIEDVYVNNFNNMFT